MFERDVRYKLSVTVCTKGSYECVCVCVTDLSQLLPQAARRHLRKDAKNLLLS